MASDFSHGLDWLTVEGNAYRGIMRFAPQTVAYIEVWHYKTSSRITREGHLKVDEIDNWIKSGPCVSPSGEEPIRSLRLIIVVLVEGTFTELEVPFTRSTAEHLMQCFNLPICTWDYRWAARMTCTRIPAWDLAGMASPASHGLLLCSGTWNLMSLARDPGSDKTCGVIRCCHGHLPNLKERLLKYSDSVIFLDILLAAITDDEIYVQDSELTTLGRELANLQRKTGFLGGLYNRNLTAHQQELSLEETIKGLSWIAQKAAKLGHDLERSQNFLRDAIGLCMEREKSQGRCTTLENITQHEPTTVRYLEYRKTQVEWNKGLATKYQEICRIQNQVVYSLIAQRDTRQNIQLAQMSASIAAASQRDSSAMRTIAFLTMVFLPGTFIAALFAMPLFNWDAESWSDVPKPRFWIYWVTTIAATLLNLTIWRLWQRVWDKQNVKVDVLPRSP